MGKDVGFRHAIRFAFCDLSKEVIAQGALGLVSL